MSILDRAGLKTPVVNFFQFSMCCFSDSDWFWRNCQQVTPAGQFDENAPPLLPLIQDSDVTLFPIVFRFHTINVFYFFERYSTPCWCYWVWSLFLFLPWLDSSSSVAFLFLFYFSIVLHSFVSVCCCLLICIQCEWHFFLSSCLLVQLEQQTRHRERCR